MMGDNFDYRSKLRTPKKEVKQEIEWENALGFGGFESLGSLTPNKFQSNVVSESTPHKSGYFLRTPSPNKSNRFQSPSKVNIFRLDNPSTPSPLKAGSSTDLFGNKSLLDNLPMPEDWDENFLDNFQEDWLLGFGSEDLEGVTKSPLQSPRRGQAFLNSPGVKSSVLSPFKSPLLTSSPKQHSMSPGTASLTPAPVGGRPLTRQRKLILQSPEKVVPVSSSSSDWRIPFSSLDTSSSSIFSEGTPEFATSTQSISSYLKQFEDEEKEEEMSVMPPISWTIGYQDPSPVGAKSQGKGKVRKHEKSQASRSVGAFKSNGNSSVHSGSRHGGGSSAKKSKLEPQFTLLRPHAELHTNQISLRMAPCTPPNKIKISRDFSQIQTLPSKEQLRIVRNRFKETLNKAVEQVIEKEMEKKAAHEQETVKDPALRTALQRPVLTATPAVVTNPVAYNIYAGVGKKPLVKKKKRL